MKKEKLV